MSRFDWVFNGELLRGVRTFDDEDETTYAIVFWDEDVGWRMDLDKAKDLYAEPPHDEAKQLGGRVFRFSERIEYEIMDEQRL